MSLKVGLLGLGTVGGGVVKILQQKRDIFRQRLGQDIVLQKVMSRRSTRLEELDLSEDIYTSSFDDFLEEPLDIVIEVIGGDAPRSTIEKALKKGIKVVTANKWLLATKGHEIINSEHGHNLFYEASCCGGIPIISSFEEGLAANNIHSLLGIFNGTCNYILSEMKFKNLLFEDVLKKAQELGYAEADPTFDIEGIDASHKLCVLSSLAFGIQVPFDLIRSEGINKLGPGDFAWAKDNGYAIKLISMAEQSEDGIFIGTFPMLIKSEHPLAHVGQANNAVFIEGDSVGELMYYGAGAGEMPTASAVVSDVLAAAENKARLRSRQVFSNNEVLKAVNEEKKFPFYLKLFTRDQVGVLAKLCSEFSQRGISLNFVHQKPPVKEWAEIVFTTHPNTIKQIEITLECIKKLDLLKSDPLVMRILES